MLVHVVYLLVIVLLGINTNFSHIKSRKQYISIVTIMLILVSGLRNMYVGPDDTFNYYIEFRSVGLMSFRDIFESLKDPVFSIMTKLLKLIIGDNFQLYLIICSSVLLIPLGRFVSRESENPMLSYLMFISLGFFYFSMVCVRQSMAIGILLLSYESLKNKNLKRFILYVLLASAFHITALVFLIVYPLSYLKYSFTVMILYITAIVVAITMGQQILGMYDLSIIDERFAAYQVGESRVLSAAGFIQLVLFAAVFALGFKSLKRKDPEETNLHCHLLSLAMIFQGMVFVIAEFFRVAWYYKVFVLILIPMILSVVGKQRRIYTAVFSLLFIVYFFLSVGSYDYAFFWQYYKPNF